jgi:hypothetical protein
MGCKKDGTSVNALTDKSTGSLIVTWTNKPVLIFDTLRLLVYNSEADYETPFATPLYDTVFTQFNNAPLDYSYRKVYPKFKAGTYWFKVFACNSPDVELFHNDNDPGKKFSVIGGQGNTLNLTTSTDSLKGFIINKITINKVSEFSNVNNNYTLNIQTWTNPSYAYAKPSQVLFNINFTTQQLPYSVANLNVTLNHFPIFWGDPSFLITSYAGSNNLDQITIDATKSFRRSKVFANNLYVWNDNNELAFVLQGTWIN